MESDGGGALPPSDENSRLIRGASGGIIDAGVQILRRKRDLEVAQDAREDRLDLQRGQMPPWTGVRALAEDGERAALLLRHRWSGVAEAVGIEGVGIGERLGIAMGQQRG